ncbi:GlsB/YeaQ/YmgE family stress response membrane protein [bacterium]|nr:GlsB/YeaQ/YmgE family stress response membrane protein [bacterium]
MNFILFLVIGGIAGWLAGKVTKGRGFGLWGNLGVGIVGALLGGFIFGILGFGSGNLLGQLIMAFIGAVVLLWLIRFFKKKA